MVKRHNNLLLRISKLDWVIFAAMAVFCFFSFQQADILHTGGSSISYLNGHILDFYSYNLQLGLGDVYMPSTYILFAIWNIPIRVLGWIIEPTMDVERKVWLWYKLLPTLFYLASGFLIYKILCQIKANQAQAKLGAFLFLSTPISFFSQFIFGQYDSFMVFFTLLGIYYWLKDDLLKFSLFFGVAITFKYTALLVFFPLLLLREKRYGKIILSCVEAAALFVIETAIYLPTGGYQCVTDFGAVGYVTNTSIQATYFSIAIIIVLWILICGYAYFQDCADRESLYKWGVYLSSMVCFLMFGLCQWHPQWVMFAVPFLVLGMVFHEKGDVFLLLDFLLMAAFVWVTVTMWPNHVDQDLLRRGILGRFIADKGNFPVIMKDLLHSPGLPICFSVFCGGLLVATLFKHPRYMLNNVSERVTEATGLIRLRYIGGIAIFVVPAMICFGIMLAQPDLLSNNGSMSAPLNPIAESSDVRQYFTASESTLTEVQVAVGTYMRENQGSLIVGLYRAETDELLAETEADISKFEDNQYCSIELPETDLNESEQYYLKFQTELNSSEDLLTIYHTAEQTANENSYAVVNGEATDFNLCVNLYGEKE